MNGIELSKEDEQQFKLLEEDTEIALESLRNLGDEAIKEKNENIQSMIDYYYTRTEQIEDRRTQIYNFSLQFLIICLAGLGLVYPQREHMNEAVFLMIMVTLLIQIIGSLAIIVINEFQSKFRYIFLQFEKYGNKWKWFYYGNEYVQQIKTRPIFPASKYTQTLKPYIKGLKKFINNYVEEDMKKEITDNIQQLYLLQVYSYYKNKFILQLTKIRLYAVYVTIVACIIILFFYL